MAFESRKLFVLQRGVSLINYWNSKPLALLVSSSVLGTYRN